MIETYTKDPKAPCIKSAKNGVQARVKTWWNRHKDCDKFLAIIGPATNHATNYIVCGDLRMVYYRTPKTLVDEVVTLYLDLKDNTYGCLENDELGIIDWTYPTWFNKYLNQAILATTGMTDKDLIEWLDISTKRLQELKTDDKIMPTSIIKMIINKFINKP